MLKSEMSGFSFQDFSFWLGAPELFTPKQKPCAVPRARLGVREAKAGGRSRAALPEQRAGLWPE
jgi:hypothetical protein